MIDGDLTKIDDISKRKLLEVLNWMSLKKEKDMYEDKGT